MVISLSLQIGYEVGWYLQADTSANRNQKYYWNPWLLWPVPLFLFIPELGWSSCVVTCRVPLWWGIEGGLLGWVSESWGCCVPFSYFLFFMYKLWAQGTPLSGVAIAWKGRTNTFEIRPFFVLLLFWFSFSSAEYVGVSGLFPSISVANKSPSLWIIASWTCHRTSGAYDFQL